MNFIEELINDRTVLINNKVELITKNVIENHKDELSILGFELRFKELPEQYNWQIEIWRIKYNARAFVGSIDVRKIVERCKYSFGDFALILEQTIYNNVRQLLILEKIKG